MVGATEKNKSPRTRKARWWGRGPERCIKGENWAFGPSSQAEPQRSALGCSIPNQGMGVGQGRWGRRPLSAPFKAGLRLATLLCWFQALGSEPTKWLSPRKDQVPTKKGEWSSHSNKWFMRACHPDHRIGSKPRSKGLPAVLSAWEAAPKASSPAQASRTSSYNKSWHLVCTKCIHGGTQASYRSYLTEPFQCYAA